MIVVVGSTALDFYGMSPRIPKDTDLWTEHDLKISLPPKTELKHVPKEILNLIPAKEVYVGHHKVLVANPDAIYTIKLSHAMYDINWDKTINDILYLRNCGFKVLPELYSALVTYWKTVHGNKEFLNLNRKKEEFFNDYVKKLYDHDVLHVIVAKETGVPLYTKLLKDGQEVLIDHAKFLTLPKAEQIQLFREEIYVIALERWLIPSDFKIPVQKAYRLSLKKTVTNLTKGWATQFILDNIEQYVKMNTRYWVTNFYNYIKKDNTMHPIIAKVKDKAEELGFEDITDAMHHAWNPEKYAESSCEFHKYLASLGFKVIEAEGGEGQGDSAHTVIELEGQLFRTDFGYASYDGYYIDDVWDWVPVNAVNKTVTVYE